jgi:hypothetical protein
MRVRVVAFLAVCAMMWAGSAWADEASVVTAITNFGLARKPGEAGNTITIVNASENPLRKDLSSSLTEYWLLNLEDITGITIDWQANLTVTGELNIDPYDGIDVILFENGTFNLTGGTIDIQTTGIGWTNAIRPERDSVVTVNGGTVKGTGVSHLGIGAEDSSVRVIVERGEVNFPNGGAILAEKLTVNDPSAITGMTFVEDSESISIDIYGNTYADPLFSPFDEHSTFIFTVKNGATWTVKPTAFKPVLDISGTKITFLTEGNGELIIRGEGSMDIYGTLTNKGRLINHGTIRNHSKNTLNNEGTLTNNGTIENTADGKITNIGTIDNTSTGTIVNEGTIDNTNGTIENKGTIKSDSAIDKVEGNPVQPLKGNGGSSGCNAAYGLFGLLLMGLAARKNLKK